MRATILGIGSALPERLVTNEELVARLDTSDEWIVRRTGIRGRRWLAPEASLAELAAAACREALADAGGTVDAADVDDVIIATITPDRLTPGLAPAVAARLGARHAGVVDLNAACAGFIYGLDHGAALIESGRARHVLVCGAEALSRVTDHDDRSTAVLFGDGAGAALIGATDAPHGIGPFEFGFDAELEELLFAERGERLLRMSGQQVYRHAVARMTEATRSVLARAGLAPQRARLLRRSPGERAHRLGRSPTLVGIPGGPARLHQRRVDGEHVRGIDPAGARRGLSRRDCSSPGARVGMVAFGAGFVWAVGLLSLEGSPGRKLRDHPIEKEHTMAELTEEVVLEGVREELAELKVAGAAEATMETEWRELDIDSLELVELVTALEDRYGVKIADGELKSISGVGDAVRLTLALANEPASA